jgi:hypothetical protein
MNNLLAASPIPIAPSGGFTGFGALGKVPDKSTGIALFTDFISKVIGVLTVIAIIWFVFTFITGAIGIISSGGDKQALENAKKKITTALIGLVLVIAAVFLVDLVGYFLGFSSGYILNLPEIFKSITNL